MQREAKTPPRQGLLQLRQAADHLSVSLRTLRSLIATGRIAVIRVSPGRVAIDPEDLNRYVAQQRQS